MDVKLMFPNIKIPVMAFIAVGVLSACALQQNPEPVVVEAVPAYEAAPKQTYVQQVDTDLINDAYLADISQHFKQKGISHIFITAGYDPESLDKNELNVTQQVEDIVDLLNKYGVQDVQHVVIPMRHIGEKSRAIISYDYRDINAQ